MTYYKCAICKAPMLTDVNTVGIQCDRCGSKYFYKQRPNMTKRLKAR